MRLNILTALFACALAACAREPFRYGAMEYASPEAALADVRSGIDANVAAVEPLPAPIALSVAIYVPSAAFAGGGVRAADQASPERRHFMAAALHSGLRGMAESIRRRNIFTHADVRESDQLRPDDPGDADYVVWFELASPDATQWYVAVRGDMSNAQPLDLPPVPDARERIGEWLSSIEQYVRQHRPAETAPNDAR